ncbi:MAG TPA: TIM barrel protein [Candidatus Limnocylindrales bacterium]|nr:TIM barrel protein [Candidatus Limnocylindrales bacterium]
MSDLLDRVAGAPITWGVDESPGWGYLMGRDRVLAEMAETGLSATELGPDGFLPTDPVELREYVSGHGMSVVGGFVPALLYRPDQIESELEYVSRASRQLAATGSKVLVLGPSSHNPGYDTPFDMSEAEWPVFLANLRRLQAIVGDAGLQTALHPHWSMAIEDGRDVERLMESSDVGLCLDTGHLYLAGTDPVDVARMAPDRVLHVHLKDVDAAAAEKVRSGEVPFRQAVIEGLFTPLGAGGVDIEGVIRILEAEGFRGWYVLEQDVSLPAEPPEGAGPKADAIESVAYLRKLATSLGAALGVG